MLQEAVCVDVQLEKRRLLEQAIAVDPWPAGVPEARDLHDLMRW